MHKLDRHRAEPPDASPVNMLMQCTASLQGFKPQGLMKLELELTWPNHCDVSLVVTVGASRHVLCCHWAQGAH